MTEVAENADLSDLDERKRLAKIVDQGAGKVVGYALPLTKLEGKWYSNSWKFKRDKMFLLPGASPMGLRLPLDRIISEIESDFAQDPSLAEGELPKREKRRSGSKDNGDQENVNHEPGDVEDNSQSPVTALCIQSYAKALGVFIPPLTSVDDYLELIESIEEVAAITGIRVQIEGYAPPPDPRLRSISLTPDPGVLEVNMPVCKSLREYSRALELVAQAAKECDLSAEKYKLDGRIVGTGGGHHITWAVLLPLKVLSSNIPRL